MLFISPLTSPQSFVVVWNRNGALAAATEVGEQVRSPTAAGLT
jgi:hypothetical protein